MKAQSKVDIRTPQGLVQAPCFHQWKQNIGGMEFEFALHIAAGHAKGFVAPLAISELGTGFDTKAVIRHPKSGAPLTSANVQGLNSADVKSVAKSALHNLIHRRIGAGRFLQAMLGAQMQLSKIDLSKYEEGGSATAGLAKPGTATASTTATQEQVAILDKMFGPKCLTCDDHQVVTTTDKDHEGNNIEMACPACIPKAIELPETKVSDMVTQPDWGSPTEEEWYESLDLPGKLAHLVHKRAQLVNDSRELTKCATKADYDRIDDMDSEVRDIDAKIAELEGKPCSN